MSYRTDTSTYICITQICYWYFCCKDFNFVRQMVIYYTEIEMMCIVHLYSRSDLKQFFFLQNVTEEIGDSIRNKVLYIKNCSHSIFIIIIVKNWTALYINYDSMIFFRKFRIIPSICTHKLLYNEWKVVLLPIIFQ